MMLASGGSSSMMLFQLPTIRLPSLMDLIEAEALPFEVKSTLHLTHEAFCGEKSVPLFANVADDHADHAPGTPPSSGA